MVNAVSAAVTIFRDLNFDTIFSRCRVQPVEQAAMARNHNGRAVFTAMHHRLSDQGNKGVQCIGIGNLDKINTAADDQFFDIHHRQRLAADAPATGRCGADSRSWPFVRLSSITSTK